MMSGSDGEMVRQGVDRCEIMRAFDIREGDRMQKPSPSLPITFRCPGPSSHVLAATFDALAIKGALATP
jgi:hypothetical protein